MPRAARLILPGVPLHVIHRGVDRSSCFRGESDYHDYWRLLVTHARASACVVHAYVFMTNHVHLLVTPPDANALGRMMKPVAQVHAQRFNRKYGRTGPLWEGRYRISHVLTEHYLLTCYRYIELNPVRAGMCIRARDYVWSSYRCNGEGVVDDLIQPHPCFLALDPDHDSRRRYYRALFDTAMTEDELGAIRNASRTGAPLGTVP